MAVVIASTPDALRYRVIYGLFMITNCGLYLMCKINSVLLSTHDINADQCTHQQYGVKSCRVLMELPLIDKIQQYLRGNLHLIGPRWTVIQTPELHKLTQRLIDGLNEMLW